MMKSKPIIFSFPKKADRKRYVCVETTHGVAVHTAIKRADGNHRTLCGRVLNSSQARVVRMSPTTCKRCLGSW